MDEANLMRESDILGGALKQRLDLRNAGVGYANEEAGAELLDRLSDGRLDLLRLPNVCK